MSDNAKQATPHDKLLAELMNSNVPKSEREHAAVREIERLRNELQDLKDAAADYDTVFEQAEQEISRMQSINKELVDKCNFYNADGARLERERDAARAQVEQYDEKFHNLLIGVENLGWPCRLDELPEYTAQLGKYLTAALDREAALEKSLQSTISVQEAWVAAGGNPGITATKEELLVALRQLDEVCDDKDMDLRDRLKAERERCVAVVENFPHWIGDNAKREIAEAIHNLGDE